jgi:hypothetical protein
MTDPHLLFAPGLIALVVLAALLQELRGRLRPRTEADKRALALLQSWLTPEQEKQWATRHEFEVVGSDTGTRYRITGRAVMNVHELDPDGQPVKQWCFAPQGGLPIGDVLLAQKIALETMEREALVVANCQPARV